MRAASHGFSLIELVVAMALMLIVGVLVSTLIGDSSSSSKYLSGSSSAGKGANMLAEQLGSDLSEAISPGRRSNSVSTNDLQSAILRGVDTNPSIQDIVVAGDTQLWILADTLRGPADRQDCIRYRQTVGSAGEATVVREVFRDTGQCPAGGAPTVSSTLMTRPPEWSSTPLFLYTVQYNEEAMRSGMLQAGRNGTMCGGGLPASWQTILARASSQHVNNPDFQMRGAIVSVSINTDNDASRNGGNSRTSTPDSSTIARYSTTLPIPNRLTTPYRYALGCGIG